MALLVVAGMARGESSQVFAIGAKSHQDHSVFKELPYSKGDVSYSLAYEYHDADAFWQLACDVTPDPGSKTNTLDYAISPQLNLILKDRIVQGGLGILSSYTHGEEGGDWMDMYWQFILGVAVPLTGAFSIEANAYYVFKDWSDLGDFDVKDIEYGAYLGYRF